MNVQILEKPAFLVTGKVLLTSQSDNTIPQFWQQCNQDGTSDFLCYFAEGMVTSNAMLGVCYGSQPDGSFHYLAGVETTKAPKIPYLQTIAIPASTWLIFESIGPMPNAIQDVWKKVFSEYLPSSEYRHAGTPDLEVYLPGDTTAEDYRCEVWVPVVHA